jgi:hypothetical protein
MSNNSPVTLTLGTTVNPTTDAVLLIPAGAPRSVETFVSPATLLGAPSGSTTGLAGSYQSLIDFKNATGTTLAATASSGEFGISISAGTSLYLVGEAANSNTKTDTCAFMFVLPPNYQAGANITLTVNCNYVVGSGTIGTHTLAAAAYLTAAAGTQGATLIATAAQSVPAAAGNAVFTITGASLVAGSALWITLAMAIQDTSGNNITGQINSVALS